MADSIELSVVIPAFNAGSTIGAQLDALLAQRWGGDWEIVVADNGSVDRTVSLVSEAARSNDRLRLVDASDQRGAAHARNVGVAAARGSLIAFCDADDVVGEGWVAAMASSLRRVPFVTGPQEYEVLNEPWLHGTFGTKTATQLQVFSDIFPYGPTANLGVRRELLERVGGFDVSIAPHEDLELCLRIWLEDVDLEFEPDAIVHYRYRETLGELWRQSVAYGAATPDIARRLAVANQQTPSRWRGLKNWLWLVRRLPSLRSKAGRARWVVVAGGAAGRVLGSVRVRYLVS